MRLLPLLSIAFLLTVAAPAHAQDPQGFIQQEHANLDSLLRQPESSSRDARINQALDTFVDYDELTRRAFGEPCHPTLPNCEDLWSQYSDAQKTEVHNLLKQLVQKSYRKNLMKTLDYTVDYHGVHASGNDTKVRTEATNVQKPRDPAVQVDYIVQQTQGGYRVVDIVTEGSSLTKNYYDQFRKMMDDPNKGYPHVVQKLRDKISKN
jgi:phospholipid transport system substrate-binding protein